MEKYTYSLLEQVQELHMFCTGSYEMSLEDAEDISCIIRDRVENWYDYNNYCKLYDSTVRLLCKIVLVEFDEKVKGLR